jgi:hypothetical protein
MTKINIKHLQKLRSKYNVHRMWAISTIPTTGSRGPQGCDFTAPGLYSSCQPYELATLLAPRGLQVRVSVNVSTLGPHYSWKNQRPGCSPQPGIKRNKVRFQVFTVTTMKNAVFWDDAMWLL